MKPVVSLANHWNRAGNVTENAFSQLPHSAAAHQRDQSRATIKYPTGHGNGTALMPTQCQWNVTWATGTLTAEGLDANGNVVCTDQKVTAGQARHVLPHRCSSHCEAGDGNTFKIYANGSDAAFILATIVDAQGNWCPTSTPNVTFSRVRARQLPRRRGQQHFGRRRVRYHSPGDHELTAEGGMCKVAVRSTFTAGTVTVNANSPGLCQGTASYNVVAPVIQVPIFDTPVGAHLGLPTHMVRPECIIETDGRMIRVFHQSTIIRLG